MYFIHYKNCESALADVRFTKNFNPVKNITTGIFSKTKFFRYFYLRIQGPFFHFLNKLQEDFELLEQPIVASSAIVEHCNKMFETSEMEKS